MTCNSGTLQCGAACSTCPASNATTWACAGSACVASACDSGYHVCSGACLLESAASCGSSCTMCPAPPLHATAACFASACAFQCSAGYLRCGNTCCTASAVVGGEAHTCAITSAGGARCWGRNIYGRLGDGTTVNRSYPVDVVGLTSGALAVSAGGYHSCAITTGGALKCWGRSNEGQIGDGATTDRPTAVPVNGMSSGVASVSAGLYHTCAVSTLGAVSCWGRNDFGEVGDGSNTQRPAPVALSALSAATVATGAYHSCALTSTGGVKCWGFGFYGALGNGGTADSNTPVDVTGLTSGVVAIASGGDHVCALLTGGTVSCWGHNGGRLGDGSTADSSLALPVTGLTGVTAIAAGTWHTCALQAGAVKCWGYNGTHQLGDGTTTTRTTPVSVAGLTGTIQAITVGNGYSCALDAAGGVRCWGTNVAGQLGDGTLTERPAPTSVQGR